MPVALDLEEIVRRCLGQIVPLVNERILAYEIQDGQYGYKAAYLELDAISGTTWNTTQDLRN